MAFPKQLFVFRDDIVVAQDNPPHDREHRSAGSPATKLFRRLLSSTTALVGVGQTGRPPLAIRSLPIMAVTMALAFSAQTSEAWAIGGIGGGGAGGAGGADSTTTTGGLGGNGGAASGGGGGGAGTTGGAGGTAGDVTSGAGGAGGASGGSVAGANVGAPLTGTNGADGIAGTSGGGGGGGAGGYGALISGTSTVNATITGGNGGAGGAAPTGFGGSGGSGGIGASLATGTVLTVNSGTTISGGAGGAAGTGATPGTAGANGVGIVGSGVTVINAGTISSGGAAANAITFTGGTNILEITSGSVVNGNVVAATAADTLRLGGTANQTFNVATIGPAAQYQGFGAYVKTGTGTATLTGTTTATTPWSINQGTLSVSANANLGAPAGGITFAGLAPGGTLETTATFTNTHAVAVATTGTVQVDPAQTLSQAAAITGAGTLNKTGTGTLVLNTAGSNAAGFNFTGTANVNTGVFQVDGTFGDVANNTATVNVNSGATLSGRGTSAPGTGTVAGSVNVLSGANLNPDDGVPNTTPGTFTIGGNLMLANGSTTKVQIVSPSSFLNDRISVGGTVTIVNAELQITGPQANGYYRLIDAGGGVTGNYDQLTLPAGDKTYVTTSGGSVNLVIGVVPLGAAHNVQYWDGTNYDGNGGPVGGNGGTGTWNATNTNWAVSVDNTITDVWGQSYAVFGGAAGTPVTVQGAQDFRNLEFVTTGYIVSGDALNMTGDPFAGRPNQSTITVDPGLATISSQLTGAAGIGLYKDGSGILDLQDATNLYTGVTTIESGKLALSGASSISQSSAVLIETGATFDISQVTSPATTPIGGAQGTSITTLGDATVGVSAGNVALGSKTLTITAGATTFSGVYRWWHRRRRFRQSYHCWRHRDPGRREHIFWSDDDCTRVSGGASNIGSDRSRLGFAVEQRIGRDWRNVRHFPGRTGNFNPGSGRLSRIAGGRQSHVGFQNTRDHRRQPVNAFFRRHFGWRYSGRRRGRSCGHRRHANFGRREHLFRADNDHTRWCRR